MRTKTVAKAKTIKSLTNMAVKYFFQRVRIQEPFVLNQSGTGVIPCYSVERKRKYIHLIRL